MIRRRMRLRFLLTSCLFLSGYPVLTGCSVLRSASDFDFSGECEAADDCEAIEGATAECMASSCMYTCDDGVADCNDDLMDGCEQSLDQSTSCGACDTTCGDEEMCDTTGREPVCASTCAEGEICSGRCIDTDEDPANCGGCGVVCSDANAEATCAGGECTLTCAENFDDCDDDSTNGCEVDLSGHTAHCGACGNACDEGTQCIEGICDPIVDGDTGDATTCFIKHSGRLYCFGNNAVGQLANGAVFTPDLEPTPVARASTDGTGPLLVRDVASGFNHVCAVSDQGELWCWGNSESGLLGNGIREASANPEPVEVRSDDANFADREFEEVASQDLHTCARSTNGEVWCWGRSFSNSASGVEGLGRGAVLQAVLIDLPSPAIAIAVGSNHSCAVLEGGQVSCWGENSLGQLGRDTRTFLVAQPPATVVVGDGSPLTGVVAIAANGFTDLGRSGTTCALRDSNDVFCWGLNTLGELGLAPPANPDVPDIVPVATRITALDPAAANEVREIAMGLVHACAATDEGVLCWGNGLFWPAWRREIPWAEASWLNTRRGR